MSGKEPDNGPGDGDTVDDIQDVEIGSADLAFSLRAERSGGGGRRVCTATHTASDGSGNEAEDGAEEPLMSVC